MCIDAGKVPYVKQLRNSTICLTVQEQYCMFDGVGTVSYIERFRNSTVFLTV